MSLSKGLILVDTKYEFGIDENRNIILIDEMHTCDSSRYWLADSYQQRFSVGMEPENFDKEIVRLYIKSKYDPYTTDPKDVIIPDDIMEKLSDTYVKFYKTLIY